VPRFKAACKLTGVDELALTDDDFADSFGLPRARWDRIRARVFAAETLEQRHVLWCAAQREWLRRLRGALPPAYQVLESEHFMVLAAARGDATHLTDYAEQARAQVMALLGERPETVGKVAVLIFAAEGDYYRYLHHFRPGGSGGIPSAGAWVNDGDRHAAINGVAGFKLTLLHELVHSHLSAPPRPRWLEEGLAEHLVRKLVTRQRAARGAIARQELRAFWSRRTLDAFWSGDAFRDKAAVHQAYALADLLVFELAGLSEADLHRFAVEARREDAGATASKAVYGVGLEVWARNVLGEGDWAPKPAPPAGDDAAAGRAPE